MAYACLIFPAGTPVLRKLKEIARICTGAVTSVSQLEAASVAASTVVVGDAAGWTLADTGSSFEATGTATKNEYRLSAPCVDGTKTKFVALRCLSRCVQTSLGNSNWSTPTASAPTSTATAGILFTPLGSAVSGNQLENAVWSTLSMASSGNVYSTDWTGADIGGANEIYVSVSNRKILVFAVAGALGSVTCAVEFPETASTVRWNNVPFTGMCGYPSAPDSTDIRYRRSYDVTNNRITTTQLAEAYGVVGNANRLCYLTNWFSPIDSLRINRIATDGVDSLMFMPVTPSMTTTNSGTLAYPLYSLIDVRANRGEGIHDLSRLSEIYYTFRSASYAAWGDEITVGSQIYVVLSSGGSTSNYRSICIKKA